MTGQSVLFVIEGAAVAATAGAPASDAQEVFARFQVGSESVGAMVSLVVLTTNSRPTGARTTLVVLLALPASLRSITIVPDVDGPYGQGRQVTPVRGI